MVRYSVRGSPVLFSFLVLLFGLVTMGFGLRWWMHGREADRWPTVEGVVVFAQMATHFDEEHRRSTSYSANIGYSYEVAGGKYTSYQVSSDPIIGSSDPNFAQKILNRYPIGRKVSVHYAPADPSDAVLETGIHGGTWIFLGVGAGCILVAGMVLLLRLSRGRPW